MNKVVSLTECEKKEIKSAWQEYYSNRLEKLEKVTKELGRKQNRIEEFVSNDFIYALDLIDELNKEMENKHGTPDFYEKLCLRVLDNIENRFFPDTCSRLRFWMRCLFPKFWPEAKPKEDFLHYLYQALTDVDDKIMFLRLIIVFLSYELPGCEHPLDALLYYYGWPSSYFSGPGARKENYQRMLDEIKRITIRKPLFNIWEPIDIPKKGDHKPSLTKPWEQIAIQEAPQ